MSEHRHQRHPHESKASLKRQFYKDDLRQWLYHHSSDVSKEVMKKHTNRKYYQSLVKSLKSEDDPKAAAMMLIDPTTLLRNHSVPDGNDEESLAGELIKHELQKEMKLSPSKSLISPGVVLTERRRRLILDKLQHGGFDDNEAIADDADHLSLSASSFGDSSQSNFEVAIKTSNQKPFVPQWDHYATMKTRWRFIRPQSQLLIPHEHMLAPHTTTHVVKSSMGEKIQGNFVEVQEFNNRDRRNLRSGGRNYGSSSNQQTFQNTGSLHLRK